ncbi:permease of the major facilitator superfamily [Corynebacterium glutamicum]|uniref:DHA2 family efflux MFS transporter permease subunit n=1 Tax=Corynebacterium glutamicum TaxID=1718 RepID=UPI00097F3B75|nr:DHA2 family efflux MFS transporter permease subunit [Corynebacterium glutamicum]SJM61901.1 permease of the major facilitator superfamily [Corynebacterium glutamicum]
MSDKKQDLTSSAAGSAAPQTKAYPAMPLPEKQAWPALIALCIGFFMILLDQTIVAVSTPALQADMGASYNEVIWVTSVYLLTFAVPLLVTGRLGDKYGPKNVYVAGMVIFTVSSLACGLAPDMFTLIIARGVQGLGAALLTPQTMATINRIFAFERRGAALGVWGSTAGLASLAGPILGGVITENWGWQWVFYINVPIGVISVIAVMKYVPEFPPLTRPLDPLSIVLSIVAVFFLVFAFQEGEGAGWAAWVWIMIVAAFALFAWFIYQQSRAKKSGNDPLVPLEIFKFRNFSLGNICIMAMGFTVAGTPLPIMLYFQQAHGMNAMEAGFMMVPQALMAAVLSPFVGKLVDRSNPGLMAALGFSTVAVSIVLLSMVMIFDTGLVWALVSMTLLGIGNAFVWAPNSTSTMRDLPHKFMGAGSGVFNTTRQLGSVIGAAAIGAVMQIRLAAGDEGAAFGQALLLAAAVLVIGIVASTMAGKMHTQRR